MRTSAGQGRMQSFGQQSLMSAGLNLPQMSSFSTNSPNQQIGLIGIMQQQQQLALLSALQQQQLSRQFSANQLPQSSQLVAQRGQGGPADPASRRRQRRSKSSADRDALPLLQSTIKDSSTDEEIAARRLRLAKDLANDAQLAQGRGERWSAARLRERAGERLLHIVENYATTNSAGEAKSLMQGLNHESGGS